MKKLSIIIGCIAMLQTICEAQQSDSTQIKLKYLLESNKAIQSDLQDIQLNLKQCHEVYRAGICMYIIGAAITGIGIANNNDTPLYAGAGLSLIGLGTIIYSHSYLRKASIGIGNNGLTAKYTF